MLLEIELGIIIILLLVSDVIFFIHFKDMKKLLFRIEKKLKK